MAAMSFTVREYPSTHSTLASANRSRTVFSILTLEE